MNLYRDDEPIVAAVADTSNPYWYFDPPKPRKVPAADNHKHPTWGDCLQTLWTVGGLLLLVVTILLSIIIPFVRSVVPAV